jgi:hypothetical protein
MRHGGVMANRNVEPTSALGRRPSDNEDESLSLLSMIYWNIDHRK